MVRFKDFLAGFLLLSCGGRVEEGPSCEEKAVEVYKDQGLGTTEPMKVCICAACAAEVVYCFDNPEVCFPWDSPEFQTLYHCSLDAFDEVCPQVKNGDGGE
jgi:formate-dependent nitrite reductase cytochrome c552 subunit